MKLHQIYAPTTLAPARDLWTLRYTMTLENGSLVVTLPACLFVSFWVYFLIFLFPCYSCSKVCERSLSGSGAGPNPAAAPQFVRGEMLPSGYLIRPCEGGGSIIHIVDHLNLEVRSFLTRTFAILLKKQNFILAFNCRLGVFLRFFDRFMNHPKLWPRELLLR